MIAKIAFAVVALFAMVAGASEHYFDDFESYPVGTNIIGQADWIAWADDPNNPSQGGARVTNQLAYRGSKSLKVGGHIDPSQYSDVVHQYAGITSGRWVFSAMTYIPLESTVGNYPAINFMTSHPALLAWGGEMKFLVEADEVLYAGAPGDKTPMLRDQWVKAVLDVDLDAAQASMYYGEAPLGKFTWPGAELAAADLWANTGSAPMYYDHVEVKPFGDLNDDGNIDDADLNLLLSAYGGERYGRDELDSLLANFGASGLNDPPGGVRVVPEPTALSLLVMGILVLLPRVFSFKRRSRLI